MEVMRELKMASGTGLREDARLPRVKNGIRGDSFRVERIAGEGLEQHEVEPDLLAHVDHLGSCH